jgi:cytochrome c553
LKTTRSLVALALIGASSLVFADGNEAISLPASDKTYTESQINDFFNVPDWYPDSHPPMPEIVQYGAKPAAFACASCHLTSGSGHPESASLAGLPVDYQVRQMQAYQRFERPSVAGVMINIARGMSEEQIRQAAEYFATLPPLAVQDVIEVENVPVTYVNSRFMRLVDRAATPAREPIGERIITVPKDEARVLARDPFATFVVHVPKGYLALGRRIVVEGKRGAAPCTSCHGPDLRGTAIAPLIAGQHADYLVAQLRDYKQGKRRGAADPDSVMANNLKYFEDREILAAAAYIASLQRQ